MSKTYTDLPLTNFPDTIDILGMRKDIDSPEIKLKIDTYLNLAKNDIQSAKEYLFQNQDLKDYMINADFINKIVQSVIAMQRLYASDFKRYIATAIKYVGEWQQNKQYSVLEVVKYNSLLYMSITNELNMNIHPVDDKFYIPITIKGDKGDHGSNLSARGIWDSTTAYSEYNVVVHKNVLYYASVANTNKEPVAGSTYWVEWLLLVDATTSQKGIVKLNNQMSTLQTEAITPYGLSQAINGHNHNNTSPTFLDISARNETLSGTLNVAGTITSSSTINVPNIIVTTSGSIGKNLNVGGTIFSEGSIETNGTIAARKADVQGDIIASGTITAAKIIGAVYN